MSTPTLRFYGLFQYIFDYYNDHLFNREIKNCIIVITRNKQTAGYYHYARWFSSSDQETDELAINPTYFVNKPLIEICQTIAHEMVHAWQYHFGKVSRPGYHDKQWASKMEEIGLMPSSTGEPGGKKTGQSMSDYPISGGLFLQVTEQLMNENVFEGLFYEVNANIASLLDPEKPLYDQVKDLTLDSDGEEEGSGGDGNKKKNKIKYNCSCSNVWGKPGLAILCQECGDPFTELG